MNLRIVIVVALLHLVERCLSVYRNNNRVIPLVVDMEVWPVRLSKHMKTISDASLSYLSSST